MPHPRPPILLFSFSSPRIYTVRACYPLPSLFLCNELNRLTNLRLVHNRFSVYIGSNCKNCLLLILLPQKSILKRILLRYNKALLPPPPCTNPSISTSGGLKRKRKRKRKLRDSIGAREEKEGERRMVGGQSSGAM